MHWFHPASCCMYIQQRHYGSALSNVSIFYWFQVAEAFALAERQDHLLEDASAKLDELKAESR